MVHQEELPQAWWFDSHNLSMAQQHALRFCLTALYFSMMDAHALLLLLCLLACGTVFIL
jgi:hypothetical protein